MMVDDQKEEEDEEWRGRSWRRRETLLQTVLQDDETKEKKGITPSS